MAQPVQVTIPSSGKKISVPTGLFINNEFVPSVDSQELIELVNSMMRQYISTDLI
jgi:aldehyde dehydrogenase (NAD+)